MGLNRGARILKGAMATLMRGFYYDDMSGEQLDGEQVEAAGVRAAGPGEQGREGALRGLCGAALGYVRTALIDARTVA